MIFRLALRDVQENDGNALDRKWQEGLRQACSLYDIVAFEYFVD